MMNITGYLTKQSCKLLGFCLQPLVQAAHLNGKIAQSHIPQTIFKIKEMAKFFFDYLQKRMVWFPRSNEISGSAHRSCPGKTATARLVDIPSEIQSLIYRNLSDSDCRNLNGMSRSIKANVAFAKRQICIELADLIKDCLVKEPKLALIFPHLVNSLTPTSDFCEEDHFKLSQTALNLRQALRTIALHWGYSQPDILLKIVEKLGYLRSGHSECDRQFEKVDTRWPYGPLIPQLLDRAIASSCITSLKILLLFIPASKRQGRDGNLSSSLAAGTPQAKGGRTDLNMAIICSLRRDLYSTAENRRFAAHYGFKAAEQLTEISPAFNCTLAKGLQSEQQDKEIWRLMRCNERRENVAKAAQILHATMEREVEVCFPIPAYAHSTHSQVDQQQLSHIPPVLWDRHLPNAKKKISYLADSEREHQNQLQRIKPSFLRAQKQPLSGDLTTQSYIHIENRTFATLVETTLFKASDEGIGVRYYRSCDSLLEALHLSLYSYTYHAIALREAVKSFLYKTKDADFPHSKLDVLFNPLQEPNWHQLRYRQGCFFPDFLSYQWLLTAAVAKLFGRQFYICSEVNCGIDYPPTVDEIDHFINCATGELRKYNLEDLEIEHQYWLRKLDGKLFISASFCPQSSSDIPTHSLIAKHNQANQERYFVPVSEDGPKGRFSPPASPNRA